MNYNHLSLAIVSYEVLMYHVVIRRMKLFLKLNKLVHVSTQLFLFWFAVSGTPS